MNQSQKISLVLLRVTLGILFLYAGWSQVSNSAWSAGGYLGGAKTFSWFYDTLARPDALSVINFVNKWGLTLLGMSLIFGVGVRLSAPVGAVLMLLYYFPILQFPYVAPHSWLVDQHIVFAAALLVLFSFRAGRIYGIGTLCVSWPLCKRYPKLHSWLD
ncbi:MAG: hypothetical protein A2754_03945 [Candidatus Magasanikbacteria bacterium RIFCSPHIGHO2_01_FULL_47_8]|uniref:DoxX subfamily n=1 Tax=Candidatus Magasanikbacteria bacterium RIFCSPHIGHO2_01_FULL_47_8 TaxID=1798673 RepID=A0A1F6MEC9_9BACT|nr:MAG: hypothetical protein A2754_03945 [Candidatus Magasanikbacteria bacterium RIFCSPHIGHO2_01_FULL_47_8]